MKLRFAPFWYDRVPQRRRPSFPRHRSNLETRVVVVGGGLTGCACAAALAAVRVPVVLVEAGQIGNGATAGAVGLVREDFDVSFTATTSAYGLRAGRSLWQSIRRAALDFPAALRRLEVSCDLTPQDLLILAVPDRDSPRRLRREYEARRKAGLDHSWVTPAVVHREAAIQSGGAIRTRGAVLDPYRACTGLARAADVRGATLFERSEVRRIKATRKAVDVITDGGVIHAETVIVATSAPISDLRQLRRHLHTRHGYGVVTQPLSPAARREVGSRSSVLRDWAEPPHFVRWLKEDRVLIEGADQDPVPARARAQALVQRTGQLMYELSLLHPSISGTLPEMSWAYTFDDTVDGLPYIGPHRNFPHHLFALGLARHGVAAAWLAAKVLTRQVTGEPGKGDDLFGFGRILQDH
jgi:glycine/D-amino acid oxidase-like deaminating enzyme